MADVSISGTTHSAQAPPIRRPKLSDSIFFPVLLPIIALILYGLVVVWSASTYTSFASLPRQIVGVVLGVVVAAVIMRYDFRVLANMSTALFVLDIVLMLLPSIPGLGVEVNGMTGWIKIPLIGLRYQPSELAKLVTIFLMASVTGQFNGRVETLKDYVRLCGILLVPFILILTQPDLGTGLVILVSGAAIIICGGAKREWVLVTLAIMVAGIALIIYTSMLEDFPVHILKPYQLNRLIVFVDPSVDPTGVGYQLQQAKIAVGSGGLFGKGVLGATQAGHGFLPESHTDFVFALLSEEFGFVGATLLLLLYAWLLFACLALALRAESPFVKLVLVGIIGMWTFQILQNIGMCIGLMPITGVPLPFISFGSSSMISQIAAVGIVLSAWKWRSKAA